MVSYLRELRSLIEDIGKFYLTILNDPFSDFYACRIDQINTYKKLKRSGMLDGLGNYVLDIGCGVGEFAYSLAKEGKNVVAIDVSKKAISEAKLRYEPRIKILRAVKSCGFLKFKHIDIFNFDSEERFDSIIALRLINNIEFRKREELLMKLENILSEGGILLISSPISSSKHFEESEFLESLGLELEKTLEESLNIMYPGRVIYPYKWTVNKYRK